MKKISRKMRVIKINHPRRIFMFLKTHLQVNKEDKLKK